MKWLVIPGAVALVLGIALRYAAVEPRSHDRSSGKSDSSSPPLANQIYGLPPNHRPAVQIESLESLLAAIELETDADRRSEALDRTVESFSTAQVPVALDSLMPLDSSAAAELRERLLRHWAETEAPKAAAWAGQLPEGSARRAAFEQIAFAWGETDLASAVGWISTLPEGESRQAATLAIAYEAARTDPLTALELARNLGLSTERDNLLVHAFSQWGGSDFATAADWAGKVSDPVLRMRLTVAAATASADHDPVTAATLIATGVDTGEIQDRAAVALVQRWAQFAPQAAAAWVRQFPESPARDAATQNLVTLWTAQDPEAAGQWLGQLSEGKLRTLGMMTHRLTPVFPGVTSSVE